MTFNSHPLQAPGGTRSFLFHISALWPKTKSLDQNNPQTLSAVTILGAAWRWPEMPSAPDLQAAAAGRRRGVRHRRLRAQVPSDPTPRWGLEIRAINSLPHLLCHLLLIASVSAVFKEKFDACALSGLTLNSLTRCFFICRYFPWLKKKKK